jgi:outer membrane receptor for ferrienterochelin and colicins
MQRKYRIAIVGWLAWWLAVSGPLGLPSEAAQEGRPKRGVFDPGSITTIAGTVLRVERTVAEAYEAHGVHLLLEAPGGPITVHLGPLWFFRSLEPRIEAGDWVRVEGSRVRIEGKWILIACRIRRGESEIRFRHANGVPVWSGWRRTPSPEDTPECALQGRVTDSSGASIPGAAVVLEPGLRTATTEVTGLFCLPTTDRRARGLRVSAAGFEERWISPIPHRGQGPVWINVVLVPAVLGESVTVTAATRTAKRLDEVPVRTELVLPELMDFSAARNLADAVDFTPGLRVESRCRTCNFSQIRMLGLEGPYTQILFDGQPTLSSLAQVYGIEQIPRRMVDRIEVVKGGGSAVYGPGSVGGVVNIIPRTPAKTAGFLSGTLEWMDGVPSQSFSASADSVSSDRSTALTAFGQVDRINPLDLSGDGFTEAARRDFEAAGVRLRRNLLEQRAEVIFDFNHIREDRRGGDRLHLPPHRAQVGEAIRSRRSSAGVGWHHTPNTGLDYRLMFSAAYMNRDSYYGSGMDPNAYGLTRNPLWVLDSQFNHFLSSHTISWGGQISSDGVEDEQPAYDRFYDETYRNIGFFVQDDWFFSPGWELVYGARMDKHTAIDRAILSPRVALMWSPRGSLRVRASWARGFQPPQVFDEDLHITQVGGEGRIIRNAEDLREEKSTTAMAGLEWRPEWGSGTGLLEWNVFFTRLKDVFHVVEDDLPATPEVEFIRTNLGRADVSGLEVNVGYVLVERLEVQLGYVEQRSRFDRPEPDFGRRDFPRTPDRYGIATLIHRNPRFADIFLGLRFTGGTQVPHYAGYIAADRLERTPAHWTVDASLSRVFPLRADSKLVVTLGGKNLTDMYQDDLDQGPNRDSGYVWGPRFPRSIYVGTSVEF